MKSNNKDLLYYKGKKISLVFEDDQMIVSPPDKTQVQPIIVKSENQSTQSQSQESQMHLPENAVIDSIGTPETIKMGDVIGGEPGEGASYKVQKNDIFVWYVDERCYVKVITGQASSRETIDEDHIVALQKFGIIDNKYNVVQTKVNTVFLATYKGEKIWEYTVIGYRGFKDEIEKMLPPTPATLKPGRTINGVTVKSKDVIIYPSQKDKIYVVRYVDPNGSGVTTADKFAGLIELGAVSDGKLSVQTQVYEYTVDTSTGTGKWEIITNDEISSELKKRKENAPSPEEVKPGNYIYDKKVQDNDLLIYVEDDKWLARKASGDPERCNEYESEWDALVGMKVVDENGEPSKDFADANQENNFYILKHDLNGWTWITSKQALKKLADSHFRELDRITSPDGKNGIKNPHEGDICVIYKYDKNWNPIDDETTFWRCVMRGRNLEWVKIETEKDMQENNGRE